MVDNLVRGTRFLVLRGLAAIAFGIIALVRPNLTLVVLLAFFGAFALIDGAFALAAGLHQLAERRTDWMPFVLGGLAGIGIGVITFFAPGITALTLVYLIAVWAIFIGVFEIMASVEMRNLIRGEWVLAVSGLLSIVFGGLIVVYPRSGALAIIWIIGLYAILAGLVRLYAAYELHSRERAVQKVM
ncbi:MAG TPA: DUF308 domain-containing protein [Chloroflexota bacterium]